jgi:hypothetical protein
MSIRRSSALTVSGAALLGGAALLLAGCGSPAATPSTPASAPSQPAAEKPATEAPATTSFGSCADLLDESAYAQLDSGLAPVSSPTTPTAGYAVDALAAGGQLCEWKDAASGATLTLVVAKPANVSSAEATVAAGSTKTEIVPGYTSYVANGGGTATGDISTFTEGGVWISLTSPLLDDAPKAQPLVEFIAQALPSG